MSYKKGVIPFPIMVVILGTLSLLASMPGCRNASRTEILERIDYAYRRGTSRLSDLTAFLKVMKDFDFERASFYEEAVQSIEKGKEASLEIRSSLEELTTCEYAGYMEELREYVLAYVQGMGPALDELEEVFRGLEELLASIKPILEVEAVLTQMEVPQSEEEWKGRLKGLKEALEVSLQSLEEVEVTSVMAEYYDYMAQLFSLMDKLVGDILVALSERGLAAEAERNPDFERLWLLIEGHGSAVEALEDALKISHLDPLMSRVELEMNRLFLEGSR